jgi:hypothetical protein
MGFTVELDYKARSKANEVAYVVADGVLPPEFEAGQLLTAKEIPHAFFGFVGVSSEFSRPLGVHRIAPHPVDVPARARNLEPGLHELL